jgi:hypothetical protein
MGQFSMEICPIGGSVPGGTQQPGHLSIGKYRFCASEDLGDGSNLRTTILPIYKEGKLSISTRLSIDLISSQPRIEVNAHTT